MDYIRRRLSRVPLQTAFSNMQRRILPSFFSLGPKKQKELVVVLYDQQLKIVGGKGIVLEEIPSDEITFLNLVPDALQEIFPDEKNIPLILVLPPAFFQFTPFELPGIKEDKLRQALRLQLPQLLPGSSENEVLGYMDFNYTDDHGCALWLKGDFVEKLFNELIKRNIILVKIIPRPVSFTVNKQRYCVEDYDKYQSTCVAIENNKICYLRVTDVSCSKLTCIFNKDCTYNRAKRILSLFDVRKIETGEVGSEVYELTLKKNFEKLFNPSIFLDFEFTKCFLRIFYEMTRNCIK